MNTYYKLYLRGIFSLCRSIIYKTELATTAANKFTLAMGQPVSTDPRQWRYYKHLAGIRDTHDPLITVRSLDDGSNILFNKEMMLIHKKTKAYYQRHAIYLKRLDTQYPLLTVYFRGVLNPIPMEKILAAKDGEILYYDPEFIERQEYSLIPRLSKWIQSQVYAYQMDSYERTDELYGVAQLAKIFTAMPGKIMELRIATMKTPETHTFHIINHLASHNRLDDFSRYLTLEQSLYLYRNIQLIERRTGLQSTFDKLIENLMSKRYLPVFDYNFRHRDMNLALSEVQPPGTMIRRPINLDTQVSSRQIDTRDIDTILEKEVSQATDNRRFLDEFKVKTHSMISSSRYSDLPTKVLESSAIDPEDIERYSLGDVIINEWQHLSYSGEFSGQVSLINPLNGDTIRTTPAQAWTLFIYAWAKGWAGVTFTSVPTTVGLGIIPNKWLTIPYYLSLIAKEPFDVRFPDANFFVTTQEEYRDLVDSTQFFEACTDILARKRYRYQYVCQAQRFSDKQPRVRMFNASYINRTFDFKDVGLDKYVDIFSQVSLEIRDMTEQSWRDFAFEILAATTNFAADEAITVSDVQSAMVRLFKRLSSYSVQFLEEVLSSSTTIYGDKSPVLDDTLASGLTHATKKLPPTAVREVGTYIVHSVRVQNHMPPGHYVSRVRYKKYYKPVDLKGTFLAVKRHGILACKPPHVPIVTRVG